MSCWGRRGDYQCPGWQSRAASIRTRDQNRCRKCNRKGRGLHVHHRFYGLVKLPFCGACDLLSVPDFALITLCERCHDVRHGRRFSHWQRAVMAVLILLGLAAFLRS